MAVGAPRVWGLGRENRSDILIDSLYSREFINAKRRVELVQVQDISQPQHKAGVSDCMQIYVLDCHTYQPLRPQCRVHRYRGAAARPSSEAILRPRPLLERICVRGEGREGLRILLACAANSEIVRG